MARAALLWIQRIVDIAYAYARAQNALGTGNHLTTCRILFQTNKSSERVCSTSAIFGSRAAVAPVSMAAAEGELYIDQNRRNLMNLILVGSAAVTVGGLAVPYILFFVPPGSGGGSGGTPAKDALGNEIFAKEYLATKKVGDHSLAQGLKGDATYLIVKDDGTLQDYGLNAVCTHLGCVVPWSSANNKFMCPCHGSQVSFFVAILVSPN